jgi:hypothetical protein
MYFLRHQRIRWVVHREEIVAIIRGIPHQAFFLLASTIPISSGILATQFGISSSDAGCLSFATMVQQSYILLSVQLHRIVQPRLLLDHRSTNSGNHTDTVFRWLSVYLLVLGMIAWGASSAVVWFILPFDYRPVLSLLPWTILAGALTSASYMASFQLTILGNQKYLSPVAMFVATSHICLCTVLLRWKSVELIAMIGVVSAVTSQLLLTIILRLHKRIEVKVN